MRTGGEAAAARRHGRVIERSSLAACSLTGQRAAGSTGGGRGRSAGVRGVRTRAGRESVAQPGSRRSELGSGAASARALKCLRARTEQRGESQRGRERGERERESQYFGLIQTQIFHGNSKNFEHESCSKFNFLQLSFQAKLRLSNDSKV